MTDAPSRIGPRAFAPLMIAAVIVQIALWTTVAVLFMNSIENDVAEGAVDGPARQLSYLRHPPLSSWVTGFAELAGPARYWALYAAALSFACVAFAIVAGWIARREGAAAGWVALAGGLMSPYASYWPIKFNHNIGIMPFWALTLVAGWGAFTSEGTAGWLLFGAAVGAGMWAKYAILHLAVPLAIFFFISPDQRRKLATPGPWLAALLAAAIAAPHFYDAFSKGGTTLQWAVHATPMPAAARVGGVVVFLLGAAAANLTFALIAAVACGPRALLAGVAKMLRRRNQTAFDRYLLFAALGPVLVIAAAGPFGVRLFYHWITPVSLSFAAFWATAAARAGLGAPPRRAIWLAALWIAATAAGFIAVREIAPFVLKAGDAAYGEMDADGLDQAIDAYWRANGAGPLRYIVSFGGKAGFQAAGSYEFDHGARVRVFEEADPRNAPWIDPADVARSGALVVSGSPPPDHVRLGARDIPVQSVTAIDRPLTRAQKAPPRLWLGVLAPVN